MTAKIFRTGILAYGKRRRSPSRARLAWRNHGGSISKERPQAVLTQDPCSTEAKSRCPKAAPEHLVSVEF